MDAYSVVLDALRVIQENESLLKSVAGATTSVTTIGKAVVTVVQQGKKLITYLIQQSREDSLGDEIGAPPVILRNDIAVLVDINRRMLVDVGRYLEDQKIEAEIYVVTNHPKYDDSVKFLDPDNPAEWEQLVQEFTQAMNKIKRARGGARIHIFLSTPVALAFGLGAVWGTVDKATVHHWEEGTYHSSMDISRKLRQSPEKST